MGPVWGCSIGGNHLRSASRTPGARLTNGRQSATLPPPQEQPSLLGNPDRHLQERVGPAALGRRPGGWLLRIRTGETGSSHSWRLPKSPWWRPAFLHRAPHSRNPAEMPQELDR